MDKLIDEKAAAATLGVSPVALRKQRCLGETPGGMPMVPFVRLGGRIRYVEADVQKYIQRLRDMEGSLSDAS